MLANRCRANGLPYRSLHGGPVRRLASATRGFLRDGLWSNEGSKGPRALLEKLHIKDPVDVAVGVLECDQLPNDDVCQVIADACSVQPAQLTLCVAPTRSIAGTVQVVARSIETSLHKLFELGFDLHQVHSAFGSAPLPPPARDFASGIGRTNDAILYGGHVTLWVDAEDSMIASLGPKVPSQSSKDWGRPFGQIFRSMASTSIASIPTCFRQPKYA